MRFPIRRFPLRLAAVWLFTIAACSSFLQDLNCLAGAQCDPNKPVDTAGSCPIYTQQIGTHDGGCLEDGTCLSAGDTCIDNACITCGQPGHVCCDQKNAAGCTASVCVTGVDDFPTCHNDCGSVGHICCLGTSDPCPTSGYCEESNGMCVPDSNDPTAGGGYFVWLLTPGKCAINPYYFNATSDSQALTLAANHLAQVNAGLDAADKLTLAPLKTIPIEYDLCAYPQLSLNSIDPETIYALNAVDLGTCKNELAGGPNAVVWGYQGPNNSCPAIPNPTPP